MRTAKETVVWKIFRHGSFEIVGESQDAGQEGSLSNCDGINYGNTAFTAMLSHEYEKTQDIAEAYINYHRYDMLIRYESKFLFPPPFSILSLVVFWVYSIMSATKMIFIKYYDCG